ncbi:alpha/beta family hydrolase [Marinomonas algicola]|uniref:alpha/beta family hydrolase n=1 Tax=Marinomonas algicola TaxID=2773454 RepID=UPI00174D9EFA|nr:alpha/beta family hydrolase [Marinomonas algicola]
MQKLSVYMAHGSSLGHESTFLSSLSATICRNLNFDLVPVTFDYMKQIEQSGRRRPPSKFAGLVDEYCSVVKQDAPSILCGKSLGARVATQCSHLKGVKGVICFGFPFYPQGKQEKHRLAFLENLSVPCLIIQGTRDPLGNYDWVSKQQLPSTVTISWFKGADHDFKVLKSIGLNQEQVIEDLVKRMSDWLTTID